MPAARLLVALIPMLILCTTAAGETFRFQGRVDLVPAPRPVASAEAIHQACTVESTESERTSPQIGSTLEADPGAKPSEDGTSSRCVVSVVYD